MVDQLPNTVQFFAALSPVPEQVIEVPKILPHDVPSRRFCREPPLVEQLVEVPTIISFSSLQRPVEQNVDIPVVGGSGAGGGLSGFLPGQSSTAFGGARYFPPATAEQIVDTPVPRDRRVLHPASSSSGLPGTANQGVFRTFPRGKKVRTWARTRGRNCSPSRAHPRRRLSWRISSRMQPVCGCAFQAVGGNFWAQIQKCGGQGEGWDGALVMRQPTTTFGRNYSCFPVLCARAVRTLNLVHYFHCPRFWQSLFRVSECNTPPRLAGLTYRWGSVASHVLTLVGDMAGEARCQRELFQSDATNIIFLFGSVFVCSVVSLWCVRGVLSRLHHHRVHGRVLGYRCRCFQPSSTVRTCQSTETCASSFAFCFRIQQRLGGSGVLGGGGGGGGGGDSAAAEGDKSAGDESIVEVPQIQFVDNQCPVRELIQRFHGCSSWTRLFVEMKVNIDKVVDVPVIMQRQVLQLRERVRYLRRLLKKIHIFKVRALTSLGNPGRYLCEPLVLAVSSADSCDSQGKLLGEFHGVVDSDPEVDSWMLPALFAQRNQDNISSAA